MYSFHLFSSLKIKDLSLPNRIVMPPMALGIATSRGEVSKEILDHYTLRAMAYRDGRPGGPLTKNDEQSARAGVGLIIVEHAYISREGQAHPQQLGIYDDGLLPGLTRLAAGIHAGGAVAGIQINHAGARILENAVAPSSIPLPFLPRRSLVTAQPQPGGTATPGAPSASAGELPRELTVAEIKMLTEKFALAAIRAKKAGFDLVEIHSAHGYLLNQFLSPLTNRRRDAYGGSLENRLRFPLEIVRAVREAVGPAYPVFYRLGADDRMEGGLTLEESRRAVPMLEAAGVDAIDLSGGLGGYMQQGPEGFFLYMADAIKPVARVPVMVTGGIKTPQFADMVIRQGRADLVGIGRALLADPAWAHKAWVTLAGIK
ncbi:NADH:flavin oxidoreductase [Moorella sulfitireducens (nom. illeg.)]|uniref:NADH:flavin oxidoreductase n=1 Tax=Neomoorella sulfitireducens TaxID=2972948 RepID=UPI0021ACEC86|nr:NADH:flavin oxidoreductase [Moorella sulfitireducens]